MDKFMAWLMNYVQAFMSWWGSLLDWPVTKTDSTTIKWQYLALLGAFIMVLFLLDLLFRH